MRKFHFCLRNVEENRNKKKCNLLSKRSMHGYKNNAKNVYAQQEILRRIFNRLVEIKAILDKQRSEKKRDRKKEMANQNTKNETRRQRVK